LVLLIVVAVFSSNVLLQKLKLSSVKSSTANCTSKKRHSSADIVLKHSQPDLRLFTTGLATETSSKGRNFIVELRTGVALGSTSKQVAKYVGCT